MHKKIKWGILGCGKIALKFASELTLSENGFLYACASSSEMKLQPFKDLYPEILTFNTYQELVDNQEIDIVYVATPHAFHMEHAHLCMQHGKAVLCEKPMAINQQQMQKMIQTAQQNNVFLMEAMWTVFLPAIQDVVYTIRQGNIGVIKHLNADFGFKSVYDAKSRLFDLNLAGGSLLDIGIYPVLMSLLIFGEPKSITASAILAESGADSSCTIMMTYSHGATASLYSSFEVFTDTKCEIYGTKGKITLPGRFHEQSHYLMRMGQEDDQFMDIGRKGLGYYHEIEHVHTCLQLDKKESPVMNFQMSTLLIRILDEIRHQIGVIYPNEK